jgi:hypothetical protein
MDAMLIFRRGITLVVPKRGAVFYLRRSDGAVGRREGDLMFWSVVVEERFEVLATEAVPDEVRELDDAIRDLVHVIEAFRR